MPSAKQTQMTSTPASTDSTFLEVAVVVVVVVEISQVAVIEVSLVAIVAVAELSQVPVAAAFTISELHQSISGVDGQSGLTVAPRTIVCELQKLQHSLP